MFLMPGNSRKFLPYSRAGNNVRVFRKPEETPGQKEHQEVSTAREYEEVSGDRKLDEVPANQEQETILVVIEVENVADAKKLD